MKRVAIIADSHFDETSRFDECVRVHDWIAQDIAARGVDLVLHAGDVYERKSTPRERRAVAEWVQLVTETAPLIIVRGNHDAPGDLPLLEKLSTIYPVRVVEGATTIGCFADIEVACLAWPTKASVLALGADSRVEGELIAGDALRNVLRGLGQQMDDAEDGAPRILLAHAMVRGSITSTGQPLVGCDLEVGLEDLALTRADFVALGHIHKGQSWPGLASESGIYAENIVYPGSPRRTAFGEVETKGYILAEFEGQRCVGWQLVETPCAPMLLLEDRWLVHDDGLAGWLDGAPEDLDVRGAEIRFRYRCDADQRDAARAAAEAVRSELLVAGAVDVKLDPIVNAVAGARAPEVARAATLADKLLALWKARGTTPSEQRLTRLTNRASQLEEEVAHAV